MRAEPRHSSTNESGADLVVATAQHKFPAWLGSGVSVEVETEDWLLKEDNNSQERVETFLWSMSYQHSTHFKASNHVKNGVYDKTSMHGSQLSLCHK